MKRLILALAAVLSIVAQASPAAALWADNHNETLVRDAA